MKLNQYSTRLIACTSLLLLGVLGSGCGDSDDDAPGGGTGLVTGSGGSSATGGLGGMGGDGPNAGERCSDEPCHVNADCLDLTQGVQCICKEGYSGDGRSCVEGDPCVGVTCTGKGEVCEVQASAGVCVCPAGFMKDADGNCNDINECRMGDVCGGGSECTNFDGGFRCDCEAGFELVGDECRDIDECAEGIDTCADTATCFNDPGSYHCDCDFDEFGDGSFCKTTDACSPNPCSTGLCVNTPSAFSCECPVGTTGADCADIVSCAPSKVLNNPTNPVIEDPVLLSAMESIFGIAPGAQLKVSDLNSRDSFSVFGGLGDEKIKSLKGLECWKNLKSFSIPDHEVTSLEPLEGLTKLENIDISCNPISNLDSLSSLTALKSLSSVKSAFTCADAASLTNLTGLSGLYRLEDLALVGHEISSLAPLSGLTSLRYVDLSDNAIINLGPLSGLLNLSELYLGANEVESLTAIAELPALRRLVVADNAIDDAGDLSKLRQLNYLDISRNEIASVQGLGGLKMLGRLFVSDNEVVDLAPLASHSNLTTLQVSQNQVSTLEPLASNADFGQSGTLTVLENPLECSDERIYIQTLRARGMSVVSSCE